MPGAARKGVDVAGGTIIQGSPDIYVNNQRLVRKGDAVQGHGLVLHAGPVMVGCSNTVFANGIKVSRKGDIASCGHPATGSEDVIIGD